jgi:copper resistance protein D
MSAEVSRALLGWPLVLSLVTTFGTAGFVLLSASERVFDLRAAAASLTILWRLLTAVIFLVSPLVLLNVTADMAGVSWAHGARLVAEVLRETHAGRIFEWFLPITLLLLLSAYIPLPPSARTVALFLFTAVLLLFQAQLSHAIDHGTVAVAVYFLHEVAAGLWVGALFALWIVERYGGPPDSWVERAARRVSRLALWSVIGVVITGAYTAYHGLGFDVDRLLFSAYGRTLIAKELLFAGVIAIGAYNRYRLMPAVGAAPARRRLLRNVTIESVLLIGALGLAALLANTPPPYGMSGVGPHSMMAM